MTSDFDVLYGKSRRGDPHEPGVATPRRAKSYWALPGYIEGSSQPEGFYVSYINNSSSNG